MSNEIKKFMRGNGLRINWLAGVLGWPKTTLYSKLRGDRPIRASELLKINKVLGTAFEGEKDGTNQKAR
jgi:plasmid maintenance system antidote protein VapI